MNPLHAIGHRLTMFFIPIVLIGLVSIGSISHQGVLLEERFGLEFMFSLRGKTVPPDKTVVIAITKQSAKRLGLSSKLYEWSRQAHADLLNSLAPMAPRHIVFDVFFEKARDERGDLAFREALKNTGKVLLFARAERERVDIGGEYQGEIQTLLQPYEPFRSAALSTGPLVLPKVPARVNRFFVRHPAYQDVSTLHAQAWLLQQPDIERARSYLAKLPTALLLNFYGPPRTVTTIEFADVIQQPEQISDWIRGATVFVGYSANEQPDQRDGFYTAFTSNSGLDVSGVEIAATAYANLKDRSFLTEPSLAISSLLVFFLGLSMYFVARLLSPLTAAGVIFVVASATTLIFFYCFVQLNLWLPWFHAVVVMTPLCAVAGMWLRSRELYSQKRRLQWAFGKYLPQEELQKLVAQKGLPELRDYHHSVCLVTDAQGYSRLSENLSPVELAGLMQDYYQAIIPPIRKSGGIISDVAGDGVIALWLHLEEHQAWSVLKPVVEEINLNIDRFNQANPTRALPTRIGIHAGEIVLGHFGAMDHHEFRAMGDIVNTTARLEGANKQLQTRVLLSEKCVDATDPSVRNLGLFKFVGKNQPLRIYTTKENTDPVLLKQYNLVQIKLESGQVESALKSCLSIQRYYPADGPTAYLVQYLTRYLSGDVRVVAQENEIKKGIIGFSSK